MSNTYDLELGQILDQARKDELQLQSQSDDSRENAQEYRARSQNKSESPAEPEPEPERPVEDITLQPPSSSSCEDPNATGNENDNDLGQTPTSLSTVEARRVKSLFPTSPSNPRNWSEKRKMTLTIALALTGFIATAGSSIGIPGIHSVRDEFNVGFRVGVLIPGAYVLGQGLGPFIFAPFSELYGRQPSYIFAEALYCVFFLATGFSNNITTLIILRFFCGMFGSVAPSLGVATCADMYVPEERGKPISIYALGPLSGPIFGNMLGYWLLHLGWRWAYYFLTILSTLNFVLLSVVMKETYAPAIQKILTFHSTRPSTKKSYNHFNPLGWIPDLSWMRSMVSPSEMLTVYTRAFSRPPRLLFSNPVAFAFSMYYAYLYGIIYLFLTTLPLLFGRPPFSQSDLFSYQWTQNVLPLAYLAIGLGFFSTVIIAANYQDKIYKYLSLKNGDKGQPEYRLVLTQIGMILLPIGLFIYGWTADSQTHWIAPIIGQYIIGVGLVLPFNTIQNFLVDAFHPYSAAAIAGATASRSIVACILPLFATEMFVNLGWGWGNTLLACVAILGIPCPFIMFLCGKRLRERYAFHG
ncbi:uncharacterized protein IL334_002531 [Kwoniella shivajii]|uniref:Major facilitator superfamily (MFS) profile domain-containing protein n=1 Tax=Kwoniella shivajii TaxID=564305 RepID=A0ABZ1CY18_9TREE|nr:hypothetical protein IL334_002531 [Kwoniella shivajii]